MRSREDLLSDVETINSTDYTRNQILYAALETLIDIRDALHNRKESEPLSAKGDQSS